MVVYYKRIVNFTEKIEIMDITVKYEGINFDLEIEHEEPEPETGYRGCFNATSIKVEGNELIDLLKESVVEDLERLAWND